MKHHHLETYGSCLKKTLSKENLEDFLGEVAPTKRGLKPHAKLGTLDIFPQKM
jgi:hypothetical protein